MPNAGVQKKEIERKGHSRLGDRGWQPPKRADETTTTKGYTSNLPCFVAKGSTTLTHACQACIKAATAPSLPPSHPPIALAVIASVATYLCQANETL